LLHGRKGNEDTTGAGGLETFEDPGSAPSTNGLDIFYPTLRNLFGRQKRSVGILESDKVPDGDIPRPDAARTKGV